MVSLAFCLELSDVIMEYIIPVQLINVILLSVKVHVIVIKYKGTFIGNTLPIGFKHVELINDKSSLNCHLVLVQNRHDFDQLQALALFFI